MRASAFELILETERIHRKADVSTGAGFAIPALYQYPAKSEEAPFLVTNAKGTFLPGVLKYGVVRLSFSECPLGEESRLLVELYRVLWKTSVQRKWGNRCSSISQAVTQMSSFGVPAKIVVVAPSFLEDACGKPVSLEEAEEVMLAQGYVAESDGVKVLVADLLEGTAIVSTDPSVVGVYFRTDNYVGALIRRIDRSLVLVNTQLAASKGDGLSNDCRPVPKN